MTQNLVLVWLGLITASTVKLKYLVGTFCNFHVKKYFKTTCEILHYISYYLICVILLIISLKKYW